MEGAMQAPAALPAAVPWRLSAPSPALRGERHGVPAGGLLLTSSLARRPPGAASLQSPRASGASPEPGQGAAKHRLPGAAGQLAGLASSVLLLQRCLLRRRRGGGARWRARCLRGAVAEADQASVVLEVKNVEAQSTDEAKLKILKGLSLTIKEGEVHAVMGPNGSGKSTLSKVLIGDSAYEVIGGEAQLGDKDLFDLEPHERALAGLFLAFQSPPAVNGVSNLDFLRAAYNAQRRDQKEPELDVIEFYGLVTEKLQQLKINPDFLNRNVNEGFSGGERKRNEMLQMSVLQPKVAILDEIDSGLDIDALKDVAEAINTVRQADAKRSLLVVTHFERFLQYIDADFVHVMYKGRIIKSGGKDLADKLDKEGYDWVIQEAGEA